MASTSRASLDNGKLQRGQACFNCRRRKRKCDGNLPCSQCTRLDIEEDCEYIDGAKRAIAHILQEDISRLQSRIHDLENPHQPKMQRDVPLHQPYHLSDLDRASTPRPTQSWRTASEPPSDMIQQLVDNFLEYSSEYGFFMSSARFRHSALLPFPIGHHSRPAPALLSTVYLWGVRLSNQPNLTAQEPVFLARAVNLTSNGLSDTHPQRVLHTLQAEILLAYFFFASGRTLEGKYHTAAGISLSLSSSLHLIRSENHSSAGILPPPVDAIEEGERIHAWWTVMILDKCWAVGLSEEPGFAHRDNLNIVDTPWPLEIDDYPKGYLGPAARYSHTMQKFVNGTPTPDAGMSTIAMLAKASFLWQRADDLARTWRSDMSPEKVSGFRSSFVRMDAMIDAFRDVLVPPNRIAKPTPAMTRALVVSHSIAHAAAMRLHGIFARTDLPAKRKRLAAARSVLGIIAAVPLRHFGYINPIMGTVWVAACGVFLDEIAALRAQRPTTRGEEEVNLRVFLSRAVAAIAVFEPTCPLMQSQISPMLENCRRVGITI
ncbi:Zn(2)-Cys(6) binuclear cluster domain-containing protein [Mycena latifolia]|nr:Zn(2)-Cys(6) binuclear cluster domain-containing protein [Mycena latifolia]